MMGWSSENDIFSDSQQEETEEIATSELICLACYERWISVRPYYTNLMELECPRCRRTGFAIESGQAFPWMDVESEEE